MSLAVHQLAAGAMAERAVALVQDRLDAGAAPAEVAVLARVNSALLPVQVALTEAGVAHSAPLDASVLGRTGVRTALAYLRLGLDTDRCARDDVLDTLNRPARKVKSAVQPHLRRAARFSLRQLEQIADVLDATHQERFAGYLADLRGLEAAITDGADTARCLWIVRNRIGLGEAMDALDSSRTRPEGSSHGDDLDALEQLAVLHPDPATFRDWLVDRLRVPADPEGVTLSTVHRVKGMEWPHVLVFAANAGLFPHRLSEDVEEERRVFHVAITRCQRTVDVLADRDRPSPFVAELQRAAPVRPAPADDLHTEVEDAPARRTPDGRVLAAVGVRLGLAGGIEGQIVRLDADAAHVRAQDGEVSVLVSVGYGSQVRADGATAVLAPAPRTTRVGATPASASRSRGSATPQLVADEPTSPADEALFEALRAWRAQVAADAGVPPYLVFHDRHLQVIAGRRPQSLRELAGCPGVGPTKLERYGDDVLDVVSSHPA